MNEQEVIKALSDYQQRLENEELSLLQNWLTALEAHRQRLKTIAKRLEEKNPQQAKTLHQEEKALAPSLSFLTARIQRLKKESALQPNPDEIPVWITDTIGQLMKDVTIEILDPKKETVLATGTTEEAGLARLKTRGELPKELILKVTDSQGRIRYTTLLPKDKIRPGTGKLFELVVESRA